MIEVKGTHLSAIAHIPKKAIPDITNIKPEI
jgi:hypothetical protein